MEKAIPQNLLIKENFQVLSHLSGQSCHSDIVEPLDKYLAGYEAVKSFCPNPIEFSYCFWYLYNEIFAFATGMQRVKIKLVNMESLNLESMEMQREKGAGPFWYSVPWDSPHLEKLVRDCIKLQD